MENDTYFTHIQKSNGRNENAYMDLFTVSNSRTSLRSCVDESEYGAGGEGDNLYSVIGQPRGCRRRSKIIIAVLIVVVIAVVVSIAVAITAAGKNESGDSSDEPSDTQPVKGSSGTTPSGQTTLPSPSDRTTTSTTETTTILTSQGTTTASDTQTTKEPVPSTPGEWASWESWTACSVTCGSGVHVRYRSCNKSQPTDHDCEGKYVQKEVCTTGICPAYGRWTTWAKWGACDTSCGGGLQLRTRQCLKSSSVDIDCYGDSTQQQSCNGWDCPDCGTSCAIGTLNGACDTCICESTIIEGRVLTTFGSPVGYASIAEASAPSKPIAESNSTGFFALIATCLTSTVVVTRDGFQDAVVEIMDTYQTVHMELESLPKITEQPQSKYRLTGEDVVFCCAAFSSPAITYYEWFFDSVLLDSGLYTNNGTSLELSNVQPNNSGKYTCRANNAERAVLSSPATLSVKDNEDEFCIDAVQPKQINLPSTCVQPGTESTLYEVGDCSSKTCRQEHANKTKQCSEISNSCCLPSRFETKSINCGDYELQLIVVKACACGACNVPSVQISGKVVSARAGSTIKYAEIWLNGEFETYTSGSGSFHASLTGSFDRAVITVKDTYNIKYLETTKVIRIANGGVGSISIAIQMLERSEPVFIDATLDSVLSMKTTKNNSVNSVALLDIPADSFFKSDGTKFTGTVSASVTFIDPTDDILKDAVPGLFQFIDEEGTTMNLASKGVFNLEFKDANGDILFIDGVIVVRFPDIHESNFTLWKLNIATGIWESLAPSIQSNKRKRRQSAGFEIGEIDMTKVVFTDWFNIGQEVDVSDNVCYFRTRIYKNKGLTEEVTGLSYEMELRHIQDDTLEMYWGDFPHYTCFAAPCENYLGYIKVLGEYSYIINDRLNIMAAEPLIMRNTLNYKIVEEDNTIGIIMTSNKVGPFYPDEAECEVSEKDENHLRFRIPSTPEVFTALEVSPKPSRDLPPGSQEFQEMQKKAWYPLRGKTLLTCFIKVKVEASMNNSSDSLLNFYVSSFGLRGLLPDTRNFLFGIRQFEVDIASGGGFYCIEYKCSGTLEGTKTVDYTQVRFTLPRSSPYRCQVQHVKESLIDYPFGEDGYKKNSKWSNDWAFKNYRSNFDIYAPTDYGGSYGVHDFTTDNLNDPEYGRTLARNRGHEECMGSHDVHDGGAAVHISCQVPDTK